MRPLLILLTLAGFIWLICYSFYSLGRRDAIKSQKRKDKASTTGRKKVESFVIENEKHSSYGEGQDKK